MHGVYVCVHVYTRVRTNICMHARVLCMCMRYARIIWYVCKYVLKLCMSACMCSCMVCMDLL